MGVCFMRIMGLDVGEKRIGIAISDPLGWTAQGHSVLEREKMEKDLKRIWQICQEEGVERIVVGLPINMNGSLGPKAVEAQQFAEELGGYTKLPVELWDERLTTKIAEKVLTREANISRRKRKKVIDKLAAVNILQNYLGSRLRS